MVATQKTYLNLISLNLLESWSVQSLLDKKVAYNKKYELARIGDFLIKSRDIVTIEDGEEYRRVTVKIRNGGVTLRDIEKGENIGTKKQYRAKAGQLIVSKIDARNGAFGIIPSELDGAVVTNDFPLFTVNEKAILSQFLVLITTTKEFIKFAQSCSSGTTNRQRMDIDLFLQQKIPLPSLQEQERIVNDYQTKIQEAENLEKQSNNKKSEIFDFLSNELGIEDPSSKQVTAKKYGLSVTTFSLLEKWGLDFIDSQIQTEKKYLNSKIKELCKISSGGTPSRNRREFYENGTIPWIKTGELNDNILNDTEEKITDEALKNSSAKLYEEGSLVIAMYGATIGKTAKLGVKASTNQACAVLFDFDLKKINPDYLWEFLQTQTENLKKLAYGSAQPNLNAGIISNYEVPLPPLSKQKEIIDFIKSKKLEIRFITEKSIQSKINAVKDFEQEIFGMS